MNNLMLVVKDSTRKETQRQTGGSQVGIGIAPSGEHLITPCCRFKTEYTAETFSRDIIDISSLC